MITLKNVEKCYKLKGGFYYVLQQINFMMEQGHFVSIMGPSGAGKSTLLHILGLHDANWEGEYHLLGHTVHTLPPKERLALQKKHTGFVFQSYHLLDDLTVYENIELPLAYRNVPKKEREAIVCDALDRFNIVGKRDLFPAQLSGGQQQLVGVVRATVAKPELLLAEEPTGNLHSDQAKEIMDLFCKLNAAGPRSFRSRIRKQMPVTERESFGLRTDGWSLTLAKGSDEIADSRSQIADGWTVASESTRRIGWIGQSPVEALFAI
jgi:ABC-type lipoprotein export system ATPase subunit